MIDIGANLASKSFQHDLDEVLERAKASGLQHIIITGSDFDSNQTALDIARKAPGFLSSTAGLHPHHADQWDAKLEQQLLQLLSKDTVKAIGETGLDYNRNFSTPENQRRAFEKHLSIATQIKKPLFLHQREAHEDFYAMLCEHKELCSSAVVHCFTDRLQALEKYIELGTMIGITGWLCDKKRGKALRDIVNHIPMDRLMIESDAPYLMPHREKIKSEMANRNRNEPHTLHYVARQLADLYQCDTDEIIQQTTNNARMFFKLDSVLTR